MSPDRLNLVESLVYLTGTVKFLTVNDQCLQELIQKDAIKALSVLLEFTKEKVTVIGENTIIFPRLVSFADCRKIDLKLIFFL